jgi:hypothetical protein
MHSFISAQAMIPCFLTGVHHARWLHGPLEMWARLHARALGEAKRPS